MSREVVLQVRGLTKRFPRLSSDADGDLIALDDLSFDLHRGEMLGVIGSNGAGKSTLLKVISEIVSPTAGEVRYSGRMTSILEVGTGFHPDLSGRENVFLSGAFHGFSRKQMETVYPEIVGFSGLHDFMDMPVKQYSSGMYLRLAFSIAFHAEVDLLLVDEVLAVGDAEFRARCNDRIRQLLAGGASILLVSHQMPQVLDFCQRVLVLEKGKKVFEGPARDGVDYYLGQTRTSRVDQVIRWSEVLADQVSLDGLLVDGQTRDAEVEYGNAISIALSVQKSTDSGSLEALIYLTDLNGFRVLTDANFLARDYGRPERKAGKWTVSCEVPAFLLNRGQYTVGVLLCLNEQPVIEYSAAGQFRVKLNPETREFRSLSEITSPAVPRLNWSFEAG